MSRVLDPEGAHLAALRRLADFRGQRVIEVGCGDGRLTLPVARDAAQVLAFDPDPEAVDDHDVRKHYSDGAELVDDFVGKKRRLPAEALPRLRTLQAPCAVRERCRLRRLRTLH